MLNHSIRIENFFRTSHQTLGTRQQGMPGRFVRRFKPRSRENDLDHYRLPENVPNSDNRIEKQLGQLSALTRDSFDETEKMIGIKLQLAMESLKRSAGTINMLLAAQDPADMTTPAAIALRHDLEALLANGNRLAQMAVQLQQGFTGDREAGQKRAECEIANVIEAIAQHRTVVQDNAIVLTEAVLAKARARTSADDVDGTNRPAPR